MISLRVLLLAGTFFTSTIAMLTLRFMAGAQVDPLPPHILEVAPYPGDEVPVDQPVTVTFDQPMDRSSVEAAWQVEPSLPGVFEWTDYAAVRFVPRGGWQRATRYEVTLDTAAQSAHGLPLEEPYRFFVQTIGILEVSTAIPAPDAEGVAADSAITVAFNRPVVPLVTTEQLAGLPQPLSFEPPLEGRGEWVNTSIYQFTPAQPLAGGTTFTGHVAAELTDPLGATLEAPFTWQFKTLPPEILNITPWQGESDVLLERGVQVEFSQPMDKASTDRAFHLVHGGEEVPGVFEWSRDARGFNFQPAQLLNIDATYLVMIAPSARSASGEATLESGLSYSFRTIPLPGVAETTPRNGDRSAYPGSGVTLYFKSPMNTATLEGKVTVVEPTGVDWTPIADPRSLTLDFATQPETTYVIGLARGAEDIYGNPIDTDFTLTFTTRALEPRAWLPASGQFMLTNAWREDTRIALQVTGKPTVDFALYRVPAELIGTAASRYGSETNRLIRQFEPVRNWSQQLDAAPLLEGVEEVLLASEEGGQLAPGVYYLTMKSPNTTHTQSLVLGVVTANLTLKRAPDEILVWVTDIESAEPAESVPVTFYDTSGAAVASGLTDADGIVRMPAISAMWDRFVTAVVEDEVTFGAWLSWGQGEPPDTLAYLYTDRPIYRPGETVYFRGVVRGRDDMTYRLPAAASVRLNASINWGSQVLFEGSLPLTEFGTFSGEINLPDDAQLGTGTIALDYSSRYPAQVSFTVAEFRVPEYKVEITPDLPAMVQGDSLRASIAASYYFGGPVSDAELNWQAYGEAAWFHYTGPGRYHFADETQPYFSWHHLGEDTATTDAAGRVIAELDSTQAPSIRPMTITIEGTAVDESGQYISGRASVLAHPADVYVGLRTDRYFGRENTPLTVDLTAVTPESVPLAAQTIRLTVVETRWERIPLEGAFGQYDWQPREIEVASDSIVTGADGTAQYTFVPPHSGIFRLRAETRDARERVNSASLRLWVTGEASVWWGRPSNTVDLIADKDVYQPGDTAEVLIPTPFTGISYALVTVERAGIQRAEVFRIDGSTLVYQLPITDQHVPTIYVSVALMKGTDAETPNPAYRTGQIALTVEPVRQRINVSVTPSATMAQPGDSVVLDVKTTDWRGEPVAAEVGVLATDLAILSLMPPNSASLEETFFGRQGNYVQTGVALEALLDVMIDELLKVQAAREDAVGAPMAAMPTASADMMEEAAMDAGLEGGPTDVAVRQDFQQTPLWAPHLVTDARGQATVELKLPDNLTTWHVDARGLTRDTRVGDAQIDVVSTLPLLTRPAVPRFFVVGDRVTLASIINNNTDASQQVAASLRAAGVTLESEATQTVTIAAAGRARVEWVVTVEDMPFVDLTFVAIGEDGHQDAARPMLATGPGGTIPVYRYTAPDTVGTGGVLRTVGARTEAISLPPRLDSDQGELTIHLDPSLAATTVDALDYLKNFPHQCVEQTVSRFLPNIMTYRALRELGIEDAALEADLRQVLDEALDRLARDQNPDGGWGWFGTMESSPYVTAYAALGLIEARHSGFDVAGAMLDRALNFVRADLIRPTIDTPLWRLNRQAFYQYVLARGGAARLDDLDAVLDYRLKLDFWAQAFLLMAYHEVAPDAPAVAQLVADLQTGAIVSATGAHWEEGARDWWNWNSDTRTTAIALAALTRTQPAYDLLPNVVRWLMVARQGDHWETTQETAWAVMALTDWMVATGELRGGYDYSLVVNGAPLAEGQVTPESVREGRVLAVDVRDLLRAEINRVTVARSEGEGVLYYSAHLRTRLWASEAQPISRGVSVTREYFAAGQSGGPVSEARAGDVITVRLTLTLPQDIYYFVLEDPIPAGTEPLDTSLLTTSRLAQPPTLRLDRDPAWWWGWWWFDHTEMRDEQVNLYADFLPRGTYTYSYQIRATFPGEYQTMPSHAYAFYFPEVFGRGSGTLFSITPAE